MGLLMVENREQENLPWKQKNKGPAEQQRQWRHSVALLQVFVTGLVPEKGFNELSLPIFNRLFVQATNTSRVTPEIILPFFDLQARRIAGSAITSDFSKSQLCYFHLLAYENGRPLWEFDKPINPMAGMHGSAITAICISIRLRRQLNNSKLYSMEQVPPTEIKKSGQKKNFHYGRTDRLALGVVPLVCPADIPSTGPDGFTGHRARLADNSLWTS
ncbi:hypothetical protein DFH08DRAFT_801840 [Mycena albidolilacea]|uniref:Uncharacterized protein n=1 Tax=Mycena albidolilacea TaxID=1033008 RepID=A0AAD7AG57_9AGAR|nr:hypothetical protein DFH08DRAFT_801840 [Mycena albidolilacea]